MDWRTFCKLGFSQFVGGFLNYLPFSKMVSVHSRNYHDICINDSINTLVSTGQQKQGWKNSWTYNILVISMQVTFSVIIWNLYWKRCLTGMKLDILEGPVQHTGVLHQLTLPTNTVSQVTTEMLHVDVLREQCPLLKLVVKRVRVALFTLHLLVIMQRNHLKSYSLCL